MNFTDQEKIGIASFLLEEKENNPILMQIAKSMIQNVCPIASPASALDIIFTHAENIQKLLNKRQITKEILFKYLHKNKVPIKEQFTKATLVQIVVDYWNYIGELKESTRQNNAVVATTTTSILPVSSVEVTVESNAMDIDTNLADVEESKYPIHLLARQFTEWFFDNYNKNTLKLNDFLPDASLELRFISNECNLNHPCVGAANVLDTLMRSKEQFGFYFNPNITHTGVQGRMNQYGMVLVLSCGTLHTNQNCVGTFECLFGLLRDPYADNHWKAKSIECLLRNQSTIQAPHLYESESLKHVLVLPAPTGDLT